MVAGKYPLLRLQFVLLPECQNETWHVSVAHDVSEQTQNIAIQFLSKRTKFMKGAENKKIAVCTKVHYADYCASLEDIMRASLKVTHADTL